ncbi:MAG TPA: hypothetical protein VE174_09695 [Actinomycetota bacterium]|nr:hypothetical protein [Actinomycetota bacterium]
MDEKQVQRALRAIEKDKAQKAVEMERLDRAEQALRDLLPIQLNGASSNGKSAVASPASKRPHSQRRRRGMKEAIRDLMTNDPNKVYSMAQMRTYLDSRNLINPAAQNPEKMIGTAVARLRSEDDRFQRVGRGQYVFRPEGSVTQVTF